jgi:hypothetical protein
MRPCRVCENEIHHGSIFCVVRGVALPTILRKKPLGRTFMLKETRAARLMASVACLALACSGGELGETCDEEGVTEGECVDGAICGKLEA